MGQTAVQPSRQEPLHQRGSHSRPPVRLYCLNGEHYLQILPDGTVGGGGLEHDPYNTLRLKAVCPGVVLIRGEATGRYLAMDQDGRLYGSPVISEECYFREEKNKENGCNSYCSQKQPGWYVGLRRSGQPEAGPTTQPNQEAVYFLPQNL